MSRRHAVLLLVAVAGVIATAVVVEGRVAAVGDELLLLAVVATVRAAAALGLAAANGEDPEEAGGEGKRGAQPGDRQERCVDIALDAVPLGRGLDGTDDYDRHGRHQRGVGTNGDCGNARDDPGQAAHSPRARGEEGEQELDAESDHGNDIDDLGPLCHSLEGVERADQLLGDIDLDVHGGANRGQAGSVQVGRGPVELGLGAVALVILAGRAETPQVDIVQVRQAEVSGGDVGIQEGGSVSAGRDGLVLCELVDGVVHIAAALGLI